MKFIKSQLVDSIGADIGCGNGKYLIASSRLNKEENDVMMNTNRLLPLIGIERSIKLAQIVNDRGMFNLFFFV